MPRHSQMLRCDCSIALSTLSAGRFTNRADNSESKVSNSSCSCKSRGSSIGECRATFSHLGSGTTDSIRRLLVSLRSREPERAGTEWSRATPRCATAWERRDGSRRLETWPCNGLNVYQGLISCKCDVPDKMLGLKRAGFNLTGAIPTFLHSILVLRFPKITG